MIDAVAERRGELMLTLVFALIAMLVSATLLHVVEGSVQPDKFGSIPRAMWWAVVTLTTIGYGDVYPVTAARQGAGGVHGGGGDRADRRADGNPGGGLQRSPAAAARAALGAAYTLMSSNDPGRGRRSNDCGSTRRGSGLGPRGWGPPAVSRAAWKKARCAACTDAAALAPAVRAGRAGGGLGRMLDIGSGVVG
jgi:hypothetical protein